MNQITIAALMAESKGSPQYNEDLIRHMVLNTIRSLRVKFIQTYGKELVLCYDGPNQWRKDIFPYYKANRKTKRDQSDFPWDKFFALLSDIRNEIKENFPYKVIQVDRCEGDDLIAVIGRNIANEHNPVLIVSSDNDFMQLHDNPHIHQYSTLKKVKIQCGDPAGYLFDHVLEGDVGDGIPNVLSDDDTFVNEEKRQKPLTKNKRSLFDKATYTGPHEYASKLQRNRMLVDFTYIPKDLQDAIMEAYLSCEIPSGKLLSYLVEKKMTNLIASASEF